MSYGLIYTVPFAALDDTPCVVEIEKSGYEGPSTELTAGETPFTVSIADDEFLYTPTRFSTARLSVVGGDYLQELFSTQYRQFRVTLLYGSVVAWCGYIKPEIYTQDYSSQLFTLEIECQSDLSILDSIDYTAQGTEMQFVSLWWLLRRCVVYASERRGGVYVPHVYASSREAYQAGVENVLDSITVSEQNFFDEDGQPMTLLEVLGEICKFLGWTCVDWAGDLYFVDIDHAGTYRRYDRLLQSLPGEDITPGTTSAQALDFMGADHSLDILGGYNKATVKCSNYPVGEQSWSMDFDGWKELAYEDLYNENNVTRRVYLQPEGLYMKQQAWDGSHFNPVQDYSPYEGDAAALNALLGALPVKCCDYEMENDGAGGWKPSITTYDYTNMIRVRTRNDNGQLPGNTTLLTLQLPAAAYSNGVICINATCGACLDANVSQIFTEYQGPYHYLRPRFELRIGDMGYNGSAFVQGYTGGFKIPMELSDDKDSGDYAIPDGKMLTDPYDGASGYLVRLPGVLKGPLLFRLFYDPNPWEVTDSDDLLQETGFLWKDLRIGFYKMNGTGGTSADGSGGGSDRVYENVINESYVNELDEIELKISSYNNDGACYGTAMLGDGHLTDNLYNSILDKAKRPEEMLITRIVNHYAAPLVKLTQPLRYASPDAVTPLTRLTDAFQEGKAFLCMGGEIDYRMNRFDCVMIEIEKE